MNYGMLIASDLKLIFRDASLRTFLFMPLLILAVIYWGLPALIRGFPVVEDYAGYVIMAATMQAATMFGFLYSMVFIDEKDLEVATVYGILPISKKGFVLLRMVPAIAISAVFAGVILVMQPYIRTSVLQILSIACLVGLITPIMALFTTVMSKNKMEGMTWYKIVNTLLNLPLVAFFISDWGHIFALIPTHWLFQAINTIMIQESTVSYVLIGIGYACTLIVVLDKRFARIHFQ